MVALEDDFSAGDEAKASGAQQMLPAAASRSRLRQAQRRQRAARHSNPVPRGPQPTRRDLAEASLIQRAYAFTL